MRMEKRFQNTLLINKGEFIVSSTFNYKILKDPMRWTDSDFFGVWDSEKQAWEIEGALDYNRYSKELALVIDAVKSKNYKLAKDELLEYYRKFNRKHLIRHNGGVLNVDQNPDLDISCSALEKNVYSVNCMNGKAMGFINVGEQPMWHSADVFVSIKRLLFGSVVHVAYQLMSVDKTDICAEFYSRKSEYKPYLELIINGEKVKVECFKDTMVSAGDNSSVNYSDREVFEVCESGYYHFHDEKMKRAYFVFDLSFIKQDDVISGATLNVYGKSCSGEKEIFVYNEFESAWDEKTFCWDNVTDELCFSCNDMNSWDFITSHRTSIKGKICFYHRSPELSAPAQMYLKTGDEKYAYTFIRNAMAIVHYVGCNPEVFNQLDMGRHIDIHTRDLFKIIDSKYMTGEYFVAIFKNIYKMADWLLHNFYGKVNNNWASYATEGVFCVTAFFKEIKVHDEWRNITIKENERLISEFKINDDSCVELAQWYHHVLLRTITDLYNIRNATGEPLPLSENSYDVLYKLMKTFYYTLSPTGCDYNIGDTTEPFKSLIYVIEGWYDLCNDIIGSDEEIKYVVTGGKEGKLPDFTTINFPDNRRTYMKTDWTKDALAMVVTGKLEGSHGHNDAFSIAMMAYGKHLITDQGYGAQLTGDIYKLMSASSSHNIVVADDVENTLLKDAEQLGFDTNDNFDYCEYSGANNEFVDTQNRSVTFCKEGKFWIVTDYIKPIDCEKITKYTQYWNMLPDAEMSIDSSNVVRSNFDDGINVMVVPVGKIEEASIVDTKYSPCAGVITDSKKAKIIKNKQGEGLFSTIIIPINKGEDFKVETKCTDYDNVNSFEAKIVSKDGSFKKYYFAHSNNQIKKISSGKYSDTCVNMLVCEDENGEVISKYLFDKQ